MGILELPDDALKNVSSFLSTPDLLQFLSTNRRTVQLSQSMGFWNTLINNGNCDGESTEVRPFFSSVEDAKRAYLTKSYVNALPAMKWTPCISSRTSPTGREGHAACTLGDRIVITGGFTDDEHVYVLQTTTGNSEQSDWQKIPPTQAKVWRHPQLASQQQPTQRPSQHNNNARMGLGREAFLEDDEDQGLANVYGATLTALDENRAVRFGGFRGGGYTGACNEIALLTLEKSEEGAEHAFTATWQVIHALNHVAPRAYHTVTLVANRYLFVLGGMTEAGCIRNELILDTHTWTWLTDAPIVNEMRLPNPSARHGHSIVLDGKRNRMVLFGGGSGSDLLRSGEDNAEVWELQMGPDWKSATSVSEFQGSLPWEWVLLHLNEDSDDEEDDAEDDDEGSGGENLQDIDDEELEEENMQDGDDEGEDSSSYGSLPPLEPRRIIDTSSEEEDEDDGDEPRPVPRWPPPAARPVPRWPPAARPAPRVVDGRNFGNMGIFAPARNQDRPVNGGGQNRPVRNNRSNRRRNAASRPNHLSDAEKLCLGRCHLAFKVSPDTAILAFGSGRPSTNRVMGFNLATNTFFRPKLGEGAFLPPARFTAAGTLFGRFNSYMLVHGGYSSQEGAAIGNMSVLDFAPAVSRSLTVMPENPEIPSSPPVTEDDALNRWSMFGRHFGHGMGIGGMEHLLQGLFVELTAGVRMDMGRGRTLGDMLRVLPRRADEDSEDDDDSDGSDVSDDDEDDGDMPQLIGGRHLARQVDDVAMGIVPRQEEDDEAPGYDTDMSEID